MYEALRASPQWNETLFLITYDEHGGFYDHVAPPDQGVPGDGQVASNGFSFDQLGVRIPTIAISPWIAKGESAVIVVVLVVVLVVAILLGSIMK